MRVLEDLCEVLEDQLKKISKKGDAISPQELDNAYKAVDIIKDITTIDAMKKAEKEAMAKEAEGYSQARGGGYSMHMPYMMEESLAGNAYARGGRGGRSYEGGNSGASYERGGSYAGRSYEGGQSNEYSEDYSGRRGRDAMGRYTSRDGGSYDSYGYSGHEEQEKEHLKQQIKQMEQKLNQM